MKQGTITRWLTYWWMLGVACALTFGGIGSALAFDLRRRESLLALVPVPRLSITAMPYPPVSNRC